PASHALLVRAAHLSYNLDYDEAMQLYTQAIAADPKDPDAYRERASSIWLHIMFTRGLVTADNYLGRFAKPPESMRTPPPGLAEQFHHDIDESIALARKAIKAHPDSADAHYELGAAYGVLASYTVTVDDARMPAFKAARDAYREESRVLEIDPARLDAGLIVGTYRYMVASLPWAIRILAKLVGFAGGKEAGLHLIERAASYPGEDQPDAQMALILLYNREKRYTDALHVLGDLEKAFPRNRLLWLEAGATALRGDMPEVAERQLDEGFDLLVHDTRERMYGEQALWLYERGATRVALGRAADATADLDACLTETGRAWVHGRAHTELGKLDDLAGRRQQAIAQYEQAIVLGKEDDDPVGVDRATALLEAPYTAATKNGR
ncbi:MAG: DUF3808 domain-containing protein, partial [Acidobacteriota bacterium]|nr:DUF3808 domain-containing protein [Acidobacteriota bacterium]